MSTRQPNQGSRARYRLWAWPSDRAPMSIRSAPGAERVPRAPIARVRLHVRITRASAGRSRPTRCDRLVTAAPTNSGRMNLLVARWRAVHSAYQADSDFLHVAEPGLLLRERHTQADRRQLSKPTIQT